MSIKSVTRMAIWTKLHGAIEKEFGVILPKQAKKEVKDIITEIAEIICTPEDKEEDYSEWPEWANYKATDGDGRSWFFECLPSVNARFNQFEISTGQASLIVENFPGWQDSLVERIR